MSVRDIAIANAYREINKMISLFSSYQSSRIHDIVRKPKLNQEKEKHEKKRS